MKYCFLVLFTIIAAFAASHAAWSPSGRHRTDDDTSSSDARTPSFYQTATDIDQSTLSSTLVVAQADNGPKTEEMKVFVDRNLIGTSTTNSLTFADLPQGTHYVIFSFDDNFYIDKYSFLEGDTCYLRASRVPTEAFDTLTFSRISKDTGTALEASGAYAVRNAKYANGNILMNQKFFDNLVDRFEHGTRFIGENKGAPSPTQFRFRPRKPGSSQ